MLMRNLRSPAGIFLVFLSSVLVISGAPQTGGDFSETSKGLPPDRIEKHPHESGVFLDNDRDVPGQVASPDNKISEEFKSSMDKGDEVVTTGVETSSEGKEQANNEATLASQGEKSSSEETKGSTMSLEEDGGILPLIISDLKFDDNTFITVAHKREKFSDPHVIATSLIARQRGVGTTNDFLEKKLTDQPKVKYIFNDLASKVAPHEMNFMEKNEVEAIPIERYLDDIASFPQKKIIVFQIGQMKAERVEELLKKISSKLLLYTLIAMYNARQENEEATLEFLKSLQSKARAFSGNKDAVFLYTDNWNSFKRKVGALVRYDEFLGYVPRDHLNIAMKDPFHSRQIFDGAASLVENAKYANTELGELAEALYNLGTVPNFKVRGQNEQVAPPQLIKAMAAARKSYQEKHAAWQRADLNQGASQLAGKEPSLIVELSKGLEELLQEEEERNYQGEIFIAKSTREKGKINETSKGRASIKDNEGEALGYVINSARVSDTEIGKALNQEMKKFVEGAILALTEMDGKKLLTSRLETGVRAGLEAFTVEATDGLHGVSILHTLDSEGDILATIKKIRENRHPHFVPAKFVLHEKGFAVAKPWNKEESENSRSPKEPEAWMLYHADEMKPKELLLESLGKSPLVPEGVEFTLKDADPFRCLDIDAKSSGEITQYKVVLDLPQVTNVKGDHVLESKITQTPDLVEDTTKTSELGLVAESNAIAHLSKIHP